jgi:hypothetical protein
VTILQWVMKLLLANVADAHASSASSASSASTPTTPMLVFVCPDHTHCALLAACVKKMGSGGGSGSPPIVVRALSGQQLSRLEVVRAFTQGTAHVSVALADIAEGLRLPFGHTVVLFGVQPSDSVFGLVNKALRPARVLCHADWPSSVLACGDGGP